jgi:hypothetical protein
MSTMPGSSAQPQMRASDADRDAILSELSTNFQEGRLSSAEFDDRSSKALAAKTMGELGVLTTDLPSGQPAPPPPETAQSYRPRRSSPQPPVVVAVAAVAIVAIVLGIAGPGTWHHAWWLVLVVLIVIRRGVGRGRR